MPEKSPLISNRIQFVSLLFHCYLIRVSLQTVTGLNSLCVLILCRILGSKQVLDFDHCPWIFQSLCFLLLDNQWCITLSQLVKGYISTPPPWFQLETNGWWCQAFIVCRFHTWLKSILLVSMRKGSLHFMSLPSPTNSKFLSGFD